MLALLPRRRFAIAASVWFLGMSVPACDGREDRTPEEATSSSKLPPRARRPIPPGQFDGEPESLLHEYQGREAITPDEAERWQLPHQAKRMAVALMTLAAHDDLDALSLVLSEHARWGLPLRQEFMARPVFADDQGAAFLDALRNSASRFRAKAHYDCPPLPPGAEHVVRNGGEPYWCFFRSDDNTDLLVLRMRIDRGRARVDYVGLFEQRPSGPIRLPKVDPAPPLIPPLLRPRQNNAITGAAPVAPRLDSTLERPPALEAAEQERHRADPADARLEADPDAVDGRPDFDPDPVGAARERGDF